MSNVVRVATTSVVLMSMLLTCARAADTATATIFLVSHGWHTGMVVSRSDHTKRRWPELALLPAGEFVEIGWGEREFYRAQNPGGWQALRAIFGINSSTLHLVAFDGPVTSYFPNSDVVPLRITPTGLDALIDYVRGSYARDTNGAPIPLGPGLYGHGVFFASGDRFYLLNTCNVWTSHALQTAGIPVATHLTAPELIADARHRAPGRSPGTSP